MDVVVRYTAADGRAFSARRAVLTGFEREFVDGSQVTVVYLPGNPRICRIKDWDLDHRQVVLLVFALPMIGGLLLVLEGSLKRLLPARTVRLDVGVARAGVHWNVRLTSVGTETALRLLPGRTQGHGLIIARWKRKRGGQEEAAATMLARALTKSGVPATAVAGKFIVLAPDAAQTMLSRLGWRDATTSDLVAIPGPEPPPADAWLATAIDADGRLRPETCGSPFYWLDSTLGPLTEAEVPLVVNRLLAIRLRELPGWRPLSGIADADLWSLGGLAVADAGLRFGLRRDRTAPALWVQVNGEPDTIRLQFGHGRWQVLRNQSVPRFMRRGFRLAILAYALMLPMLLLVGTIALVTWPIKRWERRSVARTLHRGSSAAPVRPGSRPLDAIRGALRNWRRATPSRNDRVPAAPGAKVPPQSGQSTRRPCG